MQRIFSWLLFLALFGPAVPVRAQFPAIIPQSGQVGRCNVLTGELHFDCIPLFIANIIAFLFVALGAFALLMIIIAGYQIMLGSVTGAGGDKGKATLKHAIVGLIVSLLAFALVNFVVSLATS